MFKVFGTARFYKSLIGDLPPIIDIEINYYKNNDKFTQNEFIKIGRMFGKTKDQSLKAYFKATHQQKKFEFVERRSYQFRSFKSLGRKEFGKRRK